MNQAFEPENAVILSAIRFCAWSAALLGLLHERRIDGLVEPDREDPAAQVDLRPGEARPQTRFVDTGDISRLAALRLVSAVLGGRGEGVGVRPGERGIEHGVLGLVDGGRGEVDRVGRVVLGVLCLALGLVAVELGLVLVDPLPQALDMRVPVVLDLLPAAGRPARGLFGLRVKLGRLLVGALARASSTLACNSALHDASSRP